jgi:hypothetical protein
MTSKDTITKIKEQEEKTKTTQITNKDEEYLGGSDEEDNQKTKGAVQEQAATSSNKPKTLKDLFNADASDKQVKPKTKHVQKTEKVQNQATDGKRFYNSKKVNDNKDLPQTSATQKKTYTGKGGQNSQKYNESIKPQKNYLEKDIQKEYTEDVNIAKPEFKSKAEGQNFVELNKNEDVSYLYIYIISFMCNSYLQRIWLNIILTLKKNIMMIKKKLNNNMKRKRNIIINIKNKLNILKKTLKMMLIQMDLKLLEQKKKRKRTYQENQNNINIIMKVKNVITRRKTINQVKLHHKKKVKRPKHL